MQQLPQDRVEPTLVVIFLFYHNGEDIMAKRSEKPKETKPWDRRPWPAFGDADKDTVYLWVGRTLSALEVYEAYLGLVFCKFTSDDFYQVPAIRAYSAVRTFEGRSEMLRAASEAFFSAWPDNETQEKFKSIIRDAKQFSQRRNDIAHGIVENHRPFGASLAEPTNETFALFPSWVTFKERLIDGSPEYCYSSVELEYFCNYFFVMTKTAIAFRKTIHRPKPNALRGIPQ